MIFLVVEASLKVRESLCYVLLSFGIKGISLSNRQAALDELKSNPEIEGAIVDIDSQDVDGIKLIEEIRASYSHANKIIIHTIQSNKDFVVRMVEMGVVGYLLKPYDEEEIFSKLKAILAKIESHNKQRKHIRVKPDPEEMLRLHFRLPDYPHLIAGKILDISIGGVAIELLNPPEEDILKSVARIARIQFTLSGKQFSPAGQIILQKGNFLALRFITLNTSEKTRLARYIFKRIST